MKIGILTSANQWFEPYAKKLASNFGGVSVLLNHEDLNERFDILFVLAYHKIIPQQVLAKNKHNCVIHESALPAGKGWAPLFWQVIEGRNEIIFSMFEACDSVDNGDIYLQETLVLTGYELNEELRQKQAELTLLMCEKFVKEYQVYKTPQPQIGEESFYPKRTVKDSELDFNKTLKEQFNLLRTVNNEFYPAFFELDGQRYILKIELDNALKGGQLVDFVDLSVEECLMVLKMRNYPDVRAWMYTQDEIQLEQHFQFIQNLIGDKSNQYFGVKRESQIVGVISFNQINYEKKSADFGVYANFFDASSGKGKFLTELSVLYAKKILKLRELNLEVIESNRKAVNLYRNYGFSETAQLQKHGFNVIAMTKQLGN